MNSNSKLEIIPTAKSFADRIENISNNLMEIARDLAAALDVKPALADELIEMGINHDLIRRLERLGRGQIHPRLVFATGPGSTRLLTATLSEQSRIIESGVEVLEEDEVTKRIIPVNDLTTKQTQQVFYRGGLRSLAQQRTWLRDQKKKKGIATPSQDYRVCRDCVITTKPGKWSKKLILQWLTEMG